MVDRSFLVASCHCLDLVKNQSTLGFGLFIGLPHEAALTNALDLWFNRQQRAPFLSAAYLSQLPSELCNSPGLGPELDGQARHLLRPMVCRHAARCEPGVPSDVARAVDPIEPKCNQ